eukprot:gnl/TRDRNA2_/TRDRNA2_45253_c1_seq1.p1 gnl/TRDRNA2_/TRDRNA2_45253_c1~~gnl/TRDRNA2_/TRDRNA2_45253_c1_seq1.p1  ORF type:complete len:144 (+),score=27.78 gnl/TRDRNA2_/TRDRNA2_45253_c1_seq1:30-434(+)
MSHHADGHSLDGHVLAPGGRLPGGTPPLPPLPPLPSLPKSSELVLRGDTLKAVLQDAPFEKLPQAFESGSDLTSLSIAIVAGLIGLLGLMLLCIRLCTWDENGNKNEERQYTRSITDLENLITRCEKKNGYYKK